MTDTTATTTTTATIASVQEAPLATLLPEWGNRRSVIFWSLRFCGGVVGVIVVSACVALFLNMFVKATVDNNLIQLLTTIVYTSAFVATSIIGSYVFGANFDYANSRQHIMNSITQSSLSIKSEPSP